MSNKLRLYSAFIITFILFIIINISVRNIVYRIDLTQDKLYSLAPATVNVLKSLDDIVSIKCFFSSNLPPSYQPFVRQIHDLLLEYQAIAGNKLSIEFIDPKSSPANKQLALAAGIPQIQLNIVLNDRRETIKGYFGMVIYYGNKNTTIPVISELSNLEYEITAGIVRVSTKKLPIVSLALFGDRKTDKVLRDYTKLQEMLEKQSVLKNVFLQSENIPENTDLLFIIASDNMDNTALKKIKKYIENGGKTIILDQVIRPNETMTAIVHNQKLKDIFTMLGIRIENELIYDKDCDRAWFSDSRTRFPVSYPLFPKIVPYNFNKSLPVFNRISFLSFPWITNISILDSSEVDLTPIFSTGPNWGILHGNNLDPTQKFDFNKKKKSKKALGYLINKKILIIPNSLFISDDFLPGHMANLVFTLNIVEWLTMHDMLSSIRGKNIASRELFPIEKVKDIKGTDRLMRIEWLKKYLKALNIFGPAFIVILLGILKMTLRRNKRLKYENSIKEKSSH